MLISIEISIVAEPNSTLRIDMRQHFLISATLGLFFSYLIIKISPLSLSHVKLSISLGLSLYPSSHTDTLRVRFIGVDPHTRSLSVRTSTNGP